MRRIIRKKSRKRINRFKSFRVRLIRRKPEFSWSMGETSLRF